MKVIIDFLMITFLVLCLVSGFMVFAGDGVVADLENAFVELQDLENKDLLHDLPEDISQTAQREIYMGKNSQGLKVYIDQTKLDLMEYHKYFKFCFFTFLVLFLIKLKDKVISAYRRHKSLSFTKIILEMFTKFYSLLVLSLYSELL